MERSTSPPPHLALPAPSPSLPAPSSRLEQLPPLLTPPPPPLNPDAALFSLSSASRRAVGEDLPDWLLFSPSSSEDLSSGPHGGRSASPVSSYADAVRRKGKAPMGI
jgi:hypothetical protein